MIDVFAALGTFADSPRHPFGAIRPSGQFRRTIRLRSGIIRRLRDDRLKPSTVFECTPGRGVNLFTDSTSTGDHAGSGDGLFSMVGEMHQADPAVVERQISRLQAHRSSRDNVATRAALAAVYGTYTEGFTTPDLVEAGALLEALA